MPTIVCATLYYSNGQQYINEGKNVFMVADYWNDQEFQEKQRAHLYEINSRFHELYARDF